MTRHARDANGKCGRASGLRLRAERRLSHCILRGEAARTANAWGGSVGTPQHRSCAAAEVPAVHRRLSRDRQRPGDIAHGRHASADGAGLAVLEHAGTAGGALNDAVRSHVTYLAQARKSVGSAQGNEQHSRLCAPHLTSRYANLVARCIGQVYSPPWSKAVLRLRPPAFRVRVLPPFC